MVASMVSEIGKRVFQTYEGLDNRSIVRTWFQEPEYRALVTYREIFLELRYEEGIEIVILPLILASFLAYMGNYDADYEVKFYAPTALMPEDFWAQRYWANWSGELSFRMTIQIRKR